MDVLGVYRGDWVDAENERERERERDETYAIIQSPRSGDGFDHVAWLGKGILTGPPRRLAISLTHTSSLIVQPIHRRISPETGKLSLHETKVDGEASL